MTEDELMQLIIKADPRPDVPELYAISGMEYRHFERFAALVARHEREAFIKEIEAHFVRVSRINQGLEQP